MPRRIFEQKWEELRREGKLKDMITESQQDFERSQAVEPPEVEVTMVQQAVLAQAGRGTPTSSRFAQEVLARSRAALSTSAPAIIDDPDPDPFYNFDSWRAQLTMKLTLESCAAISRFLGRFQKSINKQLSMVLFQQKRRYSPGMKVSSL